MSPNRGCQLLARLAVAIAVEVGRIARVSFQKVLRRSLVGEVVAVLRDPLNDARRCVTRRGEADGLTDDDGEDTSGRSLA